MPAPLALPASRTFAPHDAGLSLYGRDAAVHAAFAQWSDDVDWEEDEPTTWGSLGLVRRRWFHVSRLVRVLTVEGAWLDRDEVVALVGEVQVAAAERERADGLDAEEGWAV